MTEHLHAHSLEHIKDERNNRMDRVGRSGRNDSEIVGRAAQLCKVDQCRVLVQRIPP